MIAVNLTVQIEMLDGEGRASFANIERSTRKLGTYYFLLYSSANKKNSISCGAEKTTHYKFLKAILNAIKTYSRSLVTSISFLSRCTLSSLKIVKSLKKPKRTLCRYKLQNLC